MSTQVKITLQDDVYRWAKRLAQMTNCEVEDLLAQTIELSLSPVDSTAEPFKPVSELSDPEVIALTELQMNPAQDRRLSKLLDKQQAGKLDKLEQAELLSLMQIYQEKLLRKAQALRVAVQRGLRDPLTP